MLALTANARDRTRPPAHTVTEPDNVRSKASQGRRGLSHLGRTDGHYGTTQDLFGLTRAGVVWLRSRAGESGAADLTTG